MESDSDGPKSYSIPVYLTHQLVIDNVTFYMEEFRISNTITKETIDRIVENSPAAEQFYSTISELPEIQTNEINQTNSDETSNCSDDDNGNDDLSDVNRSEPLQIASFHGNMDAKIIVKV